MCGWLALSLSPLPAAPSPDSVAHAPLDPPRRGRVRVGAGRSTGFCKRSDLRRLRLRRGRLRVRPVTRASTAAA